jgi:hypothetical protein
MKYNNRLLSKTDFNESCADGYVGRLCHRCTAGYSRDGRDKCAPCFATGVGAQALAFLGISLIFIVFAILIYSSMATTLEDPTNTSIILKIAASHMQIIAIASGLPFKWSAVTVTLFRSFDVISSVSEDVVNLECVYSEEGDRSDDNSVVYATTTLILLGPFIFVMVVSIFWFIVHYVKKYKFQQNSIITIDQHRSKIKKTRTQAKAKAKQETAAPAWEKTRDNIIVSVIVVMVVVHPTLTRKSVQLLTCDTLGTDDKQTYLRRDLQIICWQGSHIAWALTVGIPFLILYALGIPLVSLFVMYRRKHKLHTDSSTVSRFGFLYLGYNKSTWYWEAIVMLRKVSMVMIDVVLGPAGVAVQALVALLMLALMFVATLQWKPFEALHVGRLEMISLVTSFMTLWTGSFFWASANVELGTTVSIFIVIINILFVIYLTTILVGDTCNDYKIVEKVKAAKHLTLSRVRSRFSVRSSSKGKSSLEMVNFETGGYVNPMYVEENSVKVALQKEERRKKMQKVRKKLAIGSSNARRHPKVACGAEEEGNTEIHIKVNAGGKLETGQHVTNNGNNETKIL